MQTELITKENLSEGQKEVRKIINSHLLEYKKMLIKEHGDFSTNSDELKYTYVDYTKGLDFYKKVRNEFLINTTIKYDEITGALLKNKEYPNIYLDWVATLSHKEDFKVSDIVVSSINKFDVAARACADNQLQLCSGGDKWYVTFAALFSLGLGIEINPGQWNLNYYKDEELLSVNSGGVHRTIAHILWGSKTMIPDSYCVYRHGRKIDDDLRKSLCFIESIFERTFKFKGTAEEITSIKDINFNSTEQEKKILSGYINKEGKYIKHYRNESYDIFELQKILNIIREFYKIHDNERLPLIWKNKLINELYNNRESLHMINYIVNEVEDLKIPIYQLEIKKNYNPLLPSYFKELFLYFKFRIKMYIEKRMNKS